MLSKIPGEVIAFHIFSKVGIKSIILLTKVSKQSHKNKRNLHLHVIRNDKLLLHFTRLHKIDLIRTLSQSSISYEVFDRIYEYIKYNNDDRVLDIRFDNIDEENKKQYQINNTFIIFKLLKSSVYSNINGKSPILDVRRKKCCDMVTSIMKNYFTNMFFARNDSKFFTSFIENMDIGWELSNINLYNICENMNLLCSEKDSEVLKINLQNFDETIVHVKEYHTLGTILMMFKWLLVSRFQPINITIYLKFIILSYSNHVFKENIHKEIVFDKVHIEHIRDMIQFEEYNVNHIYDTILTPYFKDMIINEMTTYMNNSEKYI
jgi:hypothetical protein